MSMGESHNPCMHEYCEGMATKVNGHLAHELNPKASLIPMHDCRPPIMPETAVADAIVKRTEEHLKRLGGATVSSKPIVMKVE